MPRDASTRKKSLQEVASRAPPVLINHFPARQDLIRLKWIPHSSPWCGSRRTEDWHVRFPGLIVVYGHVHIRDIHFRDRVRLKEVSLGYPSNWRHEGAIQARLREILPGCIPAQCSTEDMPCLLKTRILG